MKEENISDAFLNCLINKEFKTKEDYITFKGAEFGANWQKQKQDEFAIEFGEWLLSRAKTMLDKTNLNGLSELKTVVGETKNGRKKWEIIEWQKPTFPLIKDGIFKDNVVEFWRDKPVRFAWMNNCVGCMHKEPLLLKKMSTLHPNKLEWFASKERVSLNGATWREKITYDQIIKHKLQHELFDDDFNECDSGYCGL